MKIKAALLVSMFCSSVFAQQVQEPVFVSEEKTEDTIYLVSSRPLARLYSHPLSSGIAKMTDSSVFAMYITLGFGDTGTSSQQLMHPVALDIQRVDPQMIILDEIDAAPYLLTLLPEKYREISYFINRNTIEDLPRSRLFRVRNLGIEITDLISEMNLFPDTYYILYDSSGLTAKDSYNLKKTLKGISGSAKAIEISSVKQLDNLLLSLNKEQRGVIINNMMTIRSNEFSSFISTSEIKDIIARRNKKHLTVGLSYIPKTENEGIIFQIDYEPLIEKFLIGGMPIEDMWPLPFKIYVDKSRLRYLGYKNNYIAAHEKIDILLE